MKFALRPLACSLNAAMVLTLAACGGGGGGSDAPAPATGEAAAPAPAPAPAPGSAAPAPAPAPGPETPAPAPAPAVVTISGAVVVNMGVRNAVVCMDLNANSACDPGEPASAPTAADGSYTITYETANVSAAQAAAASLIAPMVPGSATDAGATIDAANTGASVATNAYVLRQVPGKAGQINPLTTLVAKGIADGMTEADARAAVALQLKIAAGKIDDYQDDPATGSTVQDNARWIAQVVEAALDAGVSLRVANAANASDATDGDLSLLRYVDRNNYLARTYPAQARAAGAPVAQVLDARIGRTSGSVSDNATLYNFAYLSPRGWIRCDSPWPSGIGTPSRSTYCEANESVGFTTSTDISGRTMATVISEMQADPATNAINNGISVQQLGADLGDAVFPAGSRINTRHTWTLGSNIMINSLTGDGRPQSEAQSLEELIAAKTASGASYPGNASTLTLGVSTSNFRNLRVAFTGVTNTTSGTVQFYECDLDTTQTVVTNCAATVPGTYTISTVYGARVMRFAGYAETIMNNNRIYVEVQNAPTVATGNWVYQARESKTNTASTISAQQRLNSIAWAAMKARLNL